MDPGPKERAHRVAETSEQLRNESGTWLIQVSFKKKPHTNGGMTSVFRNLKLICFIIKQKCRKWFHAS